MCKLFTNNDYVHKYLTFLHKQHFWCKCYFHTTNQLQHSGQHKTTVVHVVTRHFSWVQNITKYCSIVAGAFSPEHAGKAYLWATA